MDIANHWKLMTCHAVFGFEQSFCREQPMLPSRLFCNILLDSLDSRWQPHLLRSETSFCTLDQLNSNLECFDVFSVLCLVFRFDSCFTLFQKALKRRLLDKTEGFVETQHLQAFRIHLCLSSASHSSLKDHERLAIACSRFCPIFALPRSRVRLKWVKVSLKTPLAFVCHLRGQSWRNASVFLDFDAMRDQPYHAPGITGWGLYSKYLQWLPEMPRCS